LVVINFETISESVLLVVFKLGALVKDPLVDTLPLKPCHLLSFLSQFFRYGTLMLGEDTLKDVDLPFGLSFAKSETVIGGCKVLILWDAIVEQELFNGKRSLHLNNALNVHS